jgi:hypothetical protein
MDENIESLEVNPYIYSQLDKGAKDMHWKKESLFNKSFWEIWISIKINSKLIKGPYVRPERMKSVEENIGEML